MRFFGLNKKPVVVNNDIEDVPESKPEVVYSFVKGQYDTLREEHEARISFFNKNREAYDGIESDYFKGQGVAVNAYGDTEIFTSGLVAEQIDDAVALQMAGNPRIYPLVTVDEEMFFADGVTEPWVLSLLEDAKMTPQEIVQRYVDACVNDLIENENFPEYYTKILTDVRIDGLVTTFQFCEYNHELQRDEIKSILVDNRNIMFGRNAKSARDSKLIFIEVFLSVWEAKRLFPKYADKIKPTENDGESDGVTSPKNKNVLSTQNPHKGMVKIVYAFYWDNTEVKEKAEVDKSEDYDGNNYAEKTVSRRKYPTGRIITFIPDLGILLDDKPSEMVIWPFASLAIKPKSNSIYGSSLAAKLRPLQSYHGRLWQQLLANIQATGNTQYLSREGNIVNEQNFTNRIGQIITVKSSTGTQVLKANPVSDSIWAAIQGVEAKARAISGIYESAKGQLPTSDTSGRAVLALQSGSAQLMSLSRILFRMFLIDMWKQILELMRIHYKRGRPIRVRSDDGIPGILPFDLGLVVASIDCDVSDESAQPITPTDRLNTAMIASTNFRDEFGIPYFDGEYLAQYVRLPDIRQAISRYNARRQQFMSMQVAGAPAAQGPIGANVQRMNTGPAYEKTNNQQEPRLSISEILNAVQNPRIQT